MRRSHSRPANLSFLTRRLAVRDRVGGSGDRLPTRLDRRLRRLQSWSRRSRARTRMPTRSWMAERTPCWGRRSLPVKPWARPSRAPWPGPRFSSILQREFPPRLQAQRSVPPPGSATTSDEPSRLLSRTSNGGVTAARDIPQALSNTYSVCESFRCSISRR